MKTNFGSISLAVVALYRRPVAVAEPAAEAA